VPETVFGAFWALSDELDPRDAWMPSDGSVSSQTDAFRGLARAVSALPERKRPRRSQAAAEWDVPVPAVVHGYSVDVLPARNSPACKYRLVLEQLALVTGRNAEGAAR
jgi:hypothetical protein